MRAKNKLTLTELFVKKEKLAAAVAARPEERASKLLLHVQRARPRHPVVQHRLDSPRRRPPQGCEASRRCGGRPRSSERATGPARCRLAQPIACALPLGVGREAKQVL